VVDHQRAGLGYAPIDQGQSGLPAQLRGWPMLGRRGWAGSGECENSGFTARDIGPGGVALRRLPMVEIAS